VAGGGVVSFRRAGIINRLPERMQPAIKWGHRSVSHTKTTVLLTLGTDLSLEGDTEVLVTPQLQRGCRQPLNGGTEA
jgi:hypothetical protein